MQAPGAGAGDGPHESSHLSEADLAGFLDGDLAAAERRRVVVHLDECAACRRELVEMRQMVDSYSNSRDAAAAADGRAGRRRAWRVGLVTTLAAAGVSGLLLVRRPAAVEPPDADRPREASATGQAGGSARIAVVSPRESATFPPHGAAFTWRSAGADLYRFALLTESGEPVWTHETSDTTVSIPAAVAVRAGESYFWRVDAIADGISATTGVRTFRASR